MPYSQTSQNTLPPLSFETGRRPQKPRARGLTSIIDFGPDTMGWTGPRGVADYLSCVAEYIDYAKIYAMNALLLPEAAVTKIIRTYRDADIKPYAGGILFEYAYTKGEVEPYMRHLKKIGMPQVEVSENYITLTPGERTRYIQMLKDNGFDIIYEFGRKNPTEPMSIRALEDIIRGNLELGVDHIIIEQSEIDFTSAHDPGVLNQILNSSWFHNIFIEADPTTFPSGHVELLRKFGNDVNLANIAASQALRLQGFRHGIGRPVNYSILSEV